MRGEVPLEDVYGRRLDLVRPTREQVAALVSATCARWSLTRAKHRSAVAETRVR